MAGYSGRSLHAKLGMRPGLRFAHHAAPADYDALVAPAGAELSWIAGDPPGPGCLDLAHVFVTGMDELRAILPAWEEAIRPAGRLWVSWPKKASRIPTDVTEDRIRALALAGDLVDVKVCAVTETWSGLALVVRVERR